MQLRTVFNPGQSETDLPTLVQCRASRNSSCQSQFFQSTDYGWTGNQTTSQMFFYCKAPSGDHRHSGCSRSCKRISMIPDQSTNPWLAGQDRPVRSARTSDGIARRSVRCQTDRQRGMFRVAGSIGPALFRCGRRERFLRRQGETTLASFPFAA